MMSGQFTSRHRYPHLLFGRAPDYKKRSCLDDGPSKALTGTNIHHGDSKVVQNSSWAMTREQCHGTVTSAALDPLMLLPPLSKAMGGSSSPPSSSYFANSSSSSSEQQPGELPQPTPQDYEKHAYNGKISNDGPFDFLDTPKGIAKMQQERDMLFQTHPCSLEEPETPVDQHHGPKPLTPVQDWWQNLWCVGCTLQPSSMLPLHSNNNEGESSLSYNSLFSSVVPFTTPSTMNTTDEHRPATTASGTDIGNKNKIDCQQGSWSQMVGHSIRPSTAATTCSNRTGGSKKRVPASPLVSHSSVSSMEDDVKLTAVGQNVEKINSSNNNNQQQQQQQLPAWNQRLVVHNNATRLLSESAAFHSNATLLQQATQGGAILTTDEDDLPSLRRQQLLTEQKCVVKISSIPWTTSIKDIELLFAGTVKLPNHGGKFDQQCVHVSVM
ncbi:hypothetical protein BDB00DRAFT_486740 [Zychaea mexicana]|uniref:uncharacterized protein n=1 Tax=Zychaea mexicana TaxID=64656 RepID=UPI0022FE77E9|nr:uncharacterized protein BDB00DRAFT_486740 [Zychaea mexicana]KAI9491524.1 hypothetical protein BDB00DRAFT_486740 [Zychaea mexicana]